MNHREPPVVHGDAAGVDIGADEIWVAVPADREARPVRRFATFTDALLSLADWLQNCRIRDVAMESTGVLWIPLAEILEERGLRVCLVNARHVRHVPGRKSGVSDCQWLQYLHTVGLLQASFRPEADLGAVRALWRHREILVAEAATHVQRMQKALDQMNLKLARVISDIAGQSGLAILDAIVAGERDPEKLAALCSRRIRASAETVARSLRGHYRPEHLFVLRQELRLYRDLQAAIAACDAELERAMQSLQTAAAEEPPPSAPPPRPQRRAPGNQPQFDLRSHIHRLLGVDLATIPGVSVMTAQAVLTSIGRDPGAFRSASAFASWLGLCPERAVSGGRMLRQGTRTTSNRLNRALRLAAFSLHSAKSELGAFYRRLRARLGAPKAITAAAHKLARIIFHMLTTRLPYDETILARDHAQRQAYLARKLKRDAQALGYSLVPNPAISATP